MLLLQFIKRSSRYVKYKIRKTWYGIVDTCIYRDIDCSVGDLLLPNHDEIQGGQFVFVSRVLDLVSYKKQNDNSFRYQSAILNAQKKTNAYIEKRKQDFINLIGSIQTNGYDEKKKISVDKYWGLNDGAHRLGILYYNTIYEIPIRYYNRKSLFPMGVRWFKTTPVPSKIYQDIYDARKEIQQNLIRKGHCYCMRLSKGNEEDAKHVLYVMSSYVDFYSFYSVNIPNSQCASYFVQFVPKQGKYVVKNGGYYFDTCVQLEELLLSRFEKYNMDIRIKISHNCLEGYRMYQEVQSYVTKEIVLDFGQTRDKIIITNH